MEWSLGQAQKAWIWITPGANPGKRSPPTSPSPIGVEQITLRGLAFSIGPDRLYRAQRKRYTSVNSIPFSTSSLLYSSINVSFRWCSFADWYILLLCPFLLRTKWMSRIHWPSLPSEGNYDHSLDIQPFQGCKGGKEVLSTGCTRG